MPLLSIWDAIEQLFAPTPGELRFRVASYLSSFLTVPGEKRYKLYKDILKLYNDRSAAAHTSKDIDYQPLIESFVHMRFWLRIPLDVLDVTMMCLLIQPYSLISGLAHRLLVFQGIRDFRYATILYVSTGICRLTSFTAALTSYQLVTC
jgi:hypothetical protein